MLVEVGFLLPVLVEVGFFEEGVASFDVSALSCDATAKEKHTNYQNQTDKFSLSTHTITAFLKNLLL